LLRKRGQLVRHKTAHLLSIGNLFSRNLGVSWRSEQTRTLKPRDVDHLLADTNQALAVKASLSLVGHLQYQLTRSKRGSASKCVSGRSIAS